MPSGFNRNNKQQNKWNQSSSFIWNNQYNQRNPSEQRQQTNQQLQNLPMLQKHTVVPYLRGNNFNQREASNQLYPLYQLSQNNKSNSQQSRQSNNQFNQSRQYNQSAPSNNQFNQNRQYNQSAPSNNQFNQNRQYNQSAPNNNQFNQNGQYNQNNNQNNKNLQSQPQVNSGSPITNIPIAAMPAEYINSLPVIQPLNDFTNIPEENKDKQQEHKISDIENNSNTEYNSATLIRNFIQNERNGNIFYDHLKSISNNKDELEHFAEISSQCYKHYNYYKGIYKKLFDEDIEAENQIINTEVNSEEAIKMAAFAEADAFRDLLQLISLIDEPNIKEQLTYNLFEKLWALNYINLLYKL